jgi:hypothetical protein
MAELMYFKNVRRDGGVRIGVELDGERIFHSFQAGAGDEDPSIAWYVDVRCAGSGVPSTAAGVRTWLPTLAPYVRQGMTELATRLEVGIDEESFPVSHTVGNPPPGTMLSIHCSAIRSVRDDEIGRRLVEEAEHWEDEVRQLTGAVPAR